jgi:hypothetical protein
VVEEVLANDNLAPVLPQSWGVTAVRPELRDGGPLLVTGDLVNEARPTRHDPNKLAAATVALIRENDRRERSAA